MAVFVKCPDCETTLRAQPGQLGRRARCTKCGLVFRLASPVGQRIEEDEPEPPQVIEAPPTQQQPPPEQKPLALPDDDTPAEEERQPRRKKKKAVPQASRPWAMIATVAAVVFAAVAVGGVFLYRHLSAPDKPKPEGQPEVA